MRPALGVALIGLLALSCVASDGGPELSAWDLLAEYERLVAVNQALHEGKWPPNATNLPKHLGTFHSRAVEEIYYCGDLCPQYGKVALRYVGVAEADCAALGDPLILAAWGRQYKGCTPLIERRGRIRKKDNSLALVYEPEGSAGELTLVLDDQSQCRRKTERAPCDEVSGGQQVVVKGTKSGDALAVLKLEF